MADSGRLSKTCASNSSRLFAWICGVSVLRTVQVEQASLAGVYTVGHVPKGVSASGSGKSTLLNLLGALDVPTSGPLCYRGRPMHAAEEKALTRFRRDQVGFVLQFYCLLPSLTARENVALVTELVPGAWSPEAAPALVGLGDRLDHFPAQISGGEQERVAIARGIAKRPDLLPCDQPTGALDAANGRQVLEVLQRVNAELGTTTVVITHNAVIGELAHRIERVSDGRIAGIEVNTIRKTTSELDW